MQRLVKPLKIVGDLSQNNPYNPRSLDYSNLTMFWNNRVDFTEWYQAKSASVFKTIDFKHRSFRFK